MICPDACREAAEQMAALTEREREVVVLAGKGLSNREIGKALRRSKFTIADQLQSAMGRLQVTSRVEAAVIAAKAGLV